MWVLVFAHVGTFALPTRYDSQEACKTRARELSAAVVDHIPLSDPFQFFCIPRVEWDTVGQVSDEYLVK